MKRAVVNSLPWQAAWIAPGLAIAFAYWSGDAPTTAVVLGGLLAGLIGLAGAACAWATRKVVDRHSAAEFDEQVAEAFLTAPRLRPVHDGHARMAADIHRFAFLDQDYDDGRR